jgi:hypothetical protein
LPEVSIENGIENYQAHGSAIVTVPLWLALKAEALHLADRTSEALAVIREAEALGERSEERWWHAELYRLRGVFLAAVGADHNKIEASFCAAINSLGSRSRCRWRNAPKQLTRNTVAKKRTPQRDVDSGFLFGSFGGSLLSSVPTYSQILFFALRTAITDAEFVTLSVCTTLEHAIRPEIRN